MGDVVSALAAEAESWIISDSAKQTEKLRRERIRHYRLVKDLLLDKLPTSTMRVLEVGGGPLPISDLISFKSRVVLDPLTIVYKEIAPCRDHVTGRAEDLNELEAYDLVVATNSLDHVEDPRRVLLNMTSACKAGGFVAILGAENNAITHRHPAHLHNIDADWVHALVDGHFETVWELTYQRDGYRYGHVLWEGRRGQPAFALLLRRCTGY